MLFENVNSYNNTTDEQLIKLRKLIENKVSNHNNRISSMENKLNTVTIMNRILNLFLEENNDTPEMKISKLSRINRGEIANNLPKSMSNIESNFLDNINNILSTSFSDNDKYSKIKEIIDMLPSIGNEGGNRGENETGTGTGNENKNVVNVTYQYLIGELKRYTHDIEQFPKDANGKDYDYENPPQTYTEYLNFLVASQKFYIMIRNEGPIRSKLNYMFTEKIKQIKPYTLNTNTPVKIGNEDLPLDLDSIPPGCFSATDCLPIKNKNTDSFTNISFNTDLILKSIFWGVIFYLLSLPEVHNCIFSLVSKKVFKYKPFIMSVIFVIIYLILNQLI